MYHPRRYIWEIAHVESGRISNSGICRVAWEVSPLEKGGRHGLSSGYSLRCEECWGQSGGDNAILLPYGKSVALLERMGYFVRSLCPFGTDPIPWVVVRLHLVNHSELGLSTCWSPPPLRVSSKTAFAVLALILNRKLTHPLKFRKDMHFFLSGGSESALTVLHI